MILPLLLLFELVESLDSIVVTIFHEFDLIKGTVIIIA
jgi:hypothetical protein